MWDDQFALLAKHYHVLRYDLRGFGRSGSACADPYAPILDLEALLELLQIENTTVVGLSFGGGIAVDFALAFPSITDAVVTADAALTGAGARVCSVTYPHYVSRVDDAVR